jgi:hypothetical protein
MSLLPSDMVCLVVRHKYRHTNISKETVTSIIRAEDKAALRKYGTGYTGNGGLTLFLDIPL